VVPLRLQNWVGLCGERANQFRGQVWQSLTERVHCQ